MVLVRLKLVDVATPGTLLVAGREIEFSEGIGKDNRPLISSLCDDLALGFGEGSLPTDEPSSNTRAIGRVAGRSSDVEAPDAGRHILAIE